MGLLARIRRSQSRLARVAGVLFAVSWLALAWAPCQASAAISGGDTPGHVGSTHHGAGVQHDCPHCPAPVPDDCSQSATAHCAALQKPMLEQRDAKLALVAVADFAWLPLPPLDTAASSARPPAVHSPPPGSASLQQRYCSYLK